MLAMDGFQIYSGDRSQHWMKNFTARMGGDKIPSWMAVMSEIGRNVPVVTTGSVGLNSRCPRGDSTGVSCSELSLGGCGSWDR